MAATASAGFLAAGDPNPLARLESMLAELQASQDRLLEVLERGQNGIVHAVVARSCVLLRLLRVQNVLQSGSLFSFCSSMFGSSPPSREELLNVSGQATLRSDEVELADVQLGDLSAAGVDSAPVGSEEPRRFSGKGTGQAHAKAAQRPNHYVIKCALCAALNSVLLGYDIGVMV